MSIERKEGKTTIVGSFQDNILRFEVTAETLVVRTPTRSENYVQARAAGGVRRPPDGASRG